MKKIVYLLMLSQLWSCAPISINRSFVDAMDDEQAEYMVPGKNFEVTPGDSGKDEYSLADMRRRTPRTQEQSFAWSEEQKLEKELDRKVSKLSPEQRDWFMKNEELFANDSQKIYYLGLSPRERQEYLEHRTGSRLGVKSSKGRSVASIMRFSPRQGRTVSMGMDKSQVVSSWGNPHRIDVAGDASLENERWTFYEAGRKKFVYFTKGKVEGWVTE